MPCKGLYEETPIGASNTSQIQTLLRVEAGAICNYAGRTDENPDFHMPPGMYGHTHHVYPMPPTLLRYFIPQIHAALSSTRKSNRAPPTPFQPGKLTLQHLVQT